VAVWQDVRGRFDSEGEWNPFFNEINDGYDAIQWAATQSWSDGRVVMFGGSYVAMVQWLAAKSRNPHLKGLATFVSPGDFYQDFFYEGGAFIFGAGSMWAAFTDGKLNNDLDAAPWDRVFRFLPASRALSVIQRDPKAYRDWVAHPTYDAYWRALSWNESFPSFDFPVLHFGGWFDIFQKGTIENFRRMTTEAKPAARSKQELVVGPWGHNGQAQSKVGEVDFGPQSTAQLYQVGLSWLDRHFKGRNEGTPPKPVRVFTMGENQWREYDAWPVPGTRYVDYFLRSGGRANSASGDGSLSREKPGQDESPDRYVYDPNNPVPTKGGGNCCWPRHIPWGALDQRSVEARPDVLVYSTPPLETDLRVTGPVSLRLWISSSAPNTDFTGKLVDVAPDGFAMNLTDGIQRVTHRKGDDAPVPLVPDSPTEITVDLWNTSHLFKRGHRVRIEVSSSNFPRYSRNLNTAGPAETGEIVATARQTVYHDLGRPSRLVLPVLP
jgi:putative CocE/NonD family hydrolase